MIVQLGLWMLAVSAVMTVAAWCLDDAFRSAGVAARWLWIAALAAPAVLLAASIAPSVPLAQALPPTVDVIPLPGLDLGNAPDAGMDPLNRALLVAWGGSALAFLVVLVGAHAALGRERRAWRVVEVRGRRVRVSDRRGPAVAGLLRPVLVLPTWALSLLPHELELVLLHEEEHIRTGDPLLRLAALVFAATAAWNPAVWLQLRRLRTAVEIDCDHRVLRRAPDPAGYGASLITVAGRARSTTLALASFAEGTHALERRIRAMTTRRSRWTPLRIALGLGLGLIVGLQACSVETPVDSSADVPEADAAAPAASTVEIPAPSAAIEEEARARAAAARAEGEQAGAERPSGPSQTAFDVAPAIANRADIIAAMESEYPPLLRDAGVGGRVLIYSFVDETGTVTDVRVDESSGHQALDEAALRVGMTMRFTPAQLEGRAVPVWVSFPITFQVR